MKRGESGGSFHKELREEPGSLLNQSAETLFTEKIIFTQIVSNKI